MKKTSVVTIVIVAMSFVSVTQAMLFSVNNSELMLSFRTSSGGKNVQVDIGTVTNLLNLASGASTNFQYAYSTNQVKTNFGNSFSAVLFNVAGASKNPGNPTRVWLTDASDSSAPANFTTSDLITVRGTIVSLGTGANSGTGNAPGVNYVGAYNASQSYSYIVTGTTLTYIDQWGGTIPFVAETLAGGVQNFYEFIADDAGTTTAKLIGSFTMSSTTGVVTFTRAGGASLPPSARITNFARAGSNAQITFTTTNGVNYQLLYKTNLSQPSWITNAATGVVSGNNASQTFIDTTADQQRYYKVQSF